MNHRPAPLVFAFALMAVVFIVTLIQIGILRIAFHKLGLSGESAYLLLFASLMGSLVNIPLFTIRSDASQAQPIPAFYRQFIHRALPHFEGRTLIAVNIGGAVVPVSFCLYLLFTQDINLPDILLGVAIITLICRLISRPLPGIGIGMPIFIAPISAAMVAVLLSPEQSPMFAYISGTLGVLLGADIFRLNDIRAMGTPIASIGGAGTFDGIFITGIVAVLLA